MSLVQLRPEAPFAGVAHLVERDLAKVEVASSSLVARSKKERHPTGCLSFLGNESGEARNELQLRAPRRGVEAGSNSPGDCCVRERRAEPRSRRGIEEYVKEKIYIDGCTHFLPCDVREYRQQNLWVFFLEMCRSTGELAASTCAKRVKSRGEAGFLRMASAIRGMPGSEFEPRRPLQNTTLSGGVFSCAPRRSPSCQPADGG